MMDINTITTIIAAITGGLGANMLSNVIYDWIKKQETQMNKESGPDISIKLPSGEVIHIEVKNRERLSEIDAQMLAELLSKQVESGATDKYPQ